MERYYYSRPFPIVALFHEIFVCVPRIFVAETENPGLDRIGLVIGLVPFVENLGLFFNISIGRGKIEKNEGA